MVCKEHRAEDAVSPRPALCDKHQCFHWQRPIAAMFQRVSTQMEITETFTVTLRRFRVRARFSVEGLAKRVGYSRPHLSNIELGHRRCPSEVVSLLDDVLQADGELVRAWEMDEEMRRRQLLFVTPAALGLLRSTAVDADLEPAPVATELHRQLLTRGHGFDLAQPRGAGVIERETYQAHVLYQGAEYTTVAGMLPQLIAESERLSLTSSEPERAYQLLAVVNLVASKLAAKLGDSELAWVMADRAVTSARQIENAALCAVASGQAAISLARKMHRIGDAEAIVQTAYDQLMSTGGSTDAERISARGNLLLVNATIASRLHHRTTAEACLATASDLAANFGHDGNHLWTAFGPTNVMLHKVAVSVTLKQPASAIATAERLDTSGLSGSLVSRRAQLHLDLASAYHQTRDGAAPAVLHLMEAERIAPQIVRMNHNARELLLDLTRHERQSVTPGLRVLARRAGVIE